MIKPLGRRRKVNVLCTFNLGPVSQGKLKFNFFIITIENVCGGSDAILHQGLW